MADEQLDNVSTTTAFLNTYQELFPEESAADNSPEEEISEIVEETAAETENADNETEESDDDTESADGEEESDEENVPELDAEIAKHLPTELVERWNTQWKGVVKRETRLAAAEQSLIDGFNELETVTTLSNRLADKQTAIETYRWLGEQLKNQHGYRDEDLFGRADNSLTATEADDYDSFDDYLEQTNGDNADLRKKLKQELLSELSPVLKEFEAFKAERAQQQKQAQLQQRIKAITPAVNKELKVSDNGWQVSSEQVLEAISQLPQFESDPAEAVRRWFSTERVEHIRKTASGGKKAPELIPAAKATGEKLVSPEKLDFATAYMQLERMGEL